MRLKISTFFIILILLSFTKHNKTIRDQLKDYSVFVDVLTTKEGTLDLNTPLDSMQYYLTKLGDELKEEQSHIELFKLYSNITSKIQCGHTTLQPTKNVIKEWIKQKNSLPIDYVLYGQKLYTRKIEDEDKKTVNYGKSNYQITATIPNNCEIIAIDNKTIKTLITKIGEHLSSDEDGIEFKYFQTSQLFEFYRKITFQEKQDSTKVTYVHKKDTIDKYLFNGFPPLKTINKRLIEYEKTFKKNIEDIGKFSMFKSKYGYFKFVSFKKCRGKEYAKFLKDSFTTLQKNKTKFLLIDVRGNTGGQMQSLLMSYLVGNNVTIGKYQVTKPKKRSENKNIKKGKKDYTNHKILSFSQKILLKRNPEYDFALKTPLIEEKLQFKGKIIVITDEGSFSASSFLASNLKTLRNAKIAGHIAGGSYYKGNAGTLTCVLPKSKLTFIVNPNTFNTTLVAGNDTQTIKIPDLIVDPIYPDSKKKDEWYLSKVVKLFKEKFY